MDQTEIQSNPVIAVKGKSKNQRQGQCQESPPVWVIQWMECLGRYDSIRVTGQMTRVSGERDLNDCELGERWGVHESTISSTVLRMFSSRLL